MRWSLVSAPWNLDHTAGLGAVVEEFAGEGVGSLRGGNGIRRTTEPRPSDHAVIGSIAQVDYFAGQETPALPAPIVHVIGETAGSEL